MDHSRALGRIKSAPPVVLNPGNRVVLNSGNQPVLNRGNWVGPNWGNSASIQSLKVIKIERGPGLSTTVTEFKLHNKAVAIEKLGKHLGIFKQEEQPCEDGGDYELIAPGEKKE